MIKQSTLLLLSLLPFTSTAAPGENEQCAGIASQYRLYAEAYANGGTWHPDLGNTPPKATSEDIEGSLMNSLLFAAYHQDGVPDEQLDLNRYLIKLAYYTHSNGFSTFYGQAYTFFSCVGIATGAPEKYVHCDDGSSVYSNQSMEHYLACFGAAG